MQGDLKCLSVGPSVRLSPSVHLPAPRRVKIKKQNLGIFCRRDPSYRTFVLIVLHKTNLLVTLSHKLSFFANF